MDRELDVRALGAAVAEFYNHQIHGDGVEAAIRRYLEVAPTKREPVGGDPDRLAVVTAWADDGVLDAAACFIDPCDFVSSVDWKNLEECLAPCSGPPFVHQIVNVRLKRPEPTMPTVEGRVVDA